MMTRIARLPALLMILAASCGGPYEPQSPTTEIESSCPVAVDPDKVGSYPALTKSGGGYFYDEVLEYRVWVHPSSGDDYYQAFPTYEQALDFSETAQGAEEPLVLVLQREWIDEPEPNQFIPKKGERITEWCAEWLQDNQRQPDSVEQFLKAKQPSPAGEPSTP
jgi:hypothetical protein